MALAISFLVALCLIPLWASDDDAEARAAQLGNGLATGLASLSAAPLAQHDRIHLGVLANRLLELSAVTGVAVYTVDSEMVALTGDTQSGMTFTHPVLQDGAIIGYVRLHLDEAAFVSAQGPVHYFLSLLIVTLLPLAVVLAWQSPFRSFLSNLIRKPAIGATPVVIAEPEMTTRYLLTVNLFNQLTLSPGKRDIELEHASGIAAIIAGVYQADVLALPGTGLLLTFDHHNDPDRPTHVIYAAFALSQLLSDQDSWGRYRLGAHQITIAAEDDLTLQEGEVRDSSLLSALAKERTLVISSTLKESILRAERFELEPLTNPLLHELETTEPLAWLIRGLHGSQLDIVEQQVRELSYSRDATSSESTF